MLPWPNMRGSPCPLSSDSIRALSLAIVEACSDDVARLTVQSGSSFKLNSSSAGRLPKHSDQTVRSSPLRRFSRISVFVGLPSQFRYPVSGLPAGQRSVSKF